MKERMCDRLRRIANAREHAFRIAGRMSVDKMRAIGKIRNVAGYFSTQPEEKQFRAVLSCEYELDMIKPHEASRFSRLRERIQSLIHEAHERYAEDIH
jgi:hypothetical protein